MSGAAIPPDCRLVVFDLDGTLYRQGPVRRAMLRELLLDRGHPGRLARLAILRRFRELREGMAFEHQGDFDDRLFARLAQETGRDEEKLRALVVDWMERRPLRHLRCARVAGASELFEALRRRGIAVGVWSDYPVVKKLAALGLTADFIASALDPLIGALKPDPAGLREVMRAAGTRPDETLMIGDRMSRDGAAAASAGVPFLLLGRRAPSGIPHVPDFHALLPQMEGA
ncbi:putative hydrolase of the HAD superfamily [Palleronia aestuarii]|uniref:phosphoglycolate phosphatase n=1 Tax=Palleronia aestuarii TaxID=568105 RepID=A0A2W7NQ91_9RHOB|nr:HAD family hydrolase [Palleronia aestuarii]PZX18784.1 putative hydrolase of the HAD superfamily [Palleronia aestuarii]